ncbi:Uncharacterised protein [Bordetella pertussis]|nr:Uncharacterised protein [Bordetella pertussis]CPL56057.1 Uncharacterised protein [Bordetella pertussis]
MVPRRKLPYSMPQTMPTTRGEKPNCRMNGRSASCTTAAAIRATNRMPLSLSRHGVGKGRVEVVVVIAPSAITK